MAACMSNIFLQCASPYSTRDNGINPLSTRGTDVVKALAMGAKAVGLGRPFLFALAYGQPGVRKAIEILYKEVQTAMALVGVTSVDQLRPEHVSHGRSSSRACEARMCSNQCFGSQVDTRPLLYAGAMPRARL